LYSFKILPLVGELVANNRDAYQYLAESIRNFPDAIILKELFEDNGFKSCSFKKISADIVAIHICVK
jgi:demethylmenaquinone methyltransferase/2-methoxy-6-polyprenyl-1,4-benzoquinol methylase